jgi:hypothetical protein
VGGQIHVPAQGLHVLEAGPRRDRGRSACTRVWRSRKLAERVRSIERGTLIGHGYGYIGRRTDKKGEVCEQRCSHGIEWQRNVPEAEASEETMAHECKVRRIGHRDTWHPVNFKRLYDAPNLLCIDIDNGNRKHVSANVSSNGKLDLPIGVINGKGATIGSIRSVEQCKPQDFQSIRVRKSPPVGRILN